MYDAIVVGARCAGSPTAMLLARKGHKVLLVDAATFPSDTLSTHVVKKPAVALLDGWNLLDKVIASGCPPILSVRFDVGPIVLSGRAPPIVGVAAKADADFSPRRTVLDRILVEAATDAGAELRENFTVQELVLAEGAVVGVRGRDGRGRVVTENARIVVGADGLRSLVARSVDAPVYNAKPSLTCAYYSYWENAPIEGAELYPRPRRAVIAFPTNDNLVCVLVQCAAGDAAEFRRDLEASYLAALDLAPDLAERLRAGRRAEPIRGTAHLPNFFRKPFGRGWALVGDAGLHRDPIIAQGICDAFRDADLLSSALDAAFSGREPIGHALARYEEMRNAAAGPIFHLTCQLAELALPSVEMQQLFGALRHDQHETDRFIGALIGTVPVPEFFAPANLARIIAGTAARIA